MSPTILVIPKFLIRPLGAKFGKLRAALHPTLNVMHQDYSAIAGNDAVWPIAMTGNTYPARSSHMSDINGNFPAEPWARGSPAWQGHRFHTEETIPDHELTPYL